MEPIRVGPLLVTGRPVGDADRAFLLPVYASTRAAELAPLPWSDDEKRRFTRHQFEAQEVAYRKNYPGAEWLVLGVDGTDAGRLYVHRRAGEIRVMDLALLPDFRNRGIGAALLRQILDEGARSGRRVSIHVEIFSPAMRLYERLGFRRVGGTEVYALLEWSPEPGLKPAG